MCFQLEPSAPCRCGAVVRAFRVHHADLLPLGSTRTTSTRSRHIVIRGGEIDQGLDEQAGSDEQHERERDLCNDEKPGGTHTAKRACRTIDTANRGRYFDFAPRESPARTRRPRCTGKTSRW